MCGGVKLQAIQVQRNWRRSRRLRGGGLENLLIDFLLFDLHYFCFEDFKHQNVVDAIAFNLLENQLIEVTVASIFGIGGVIRCARVEVDGVTSQL